MLMIAVVIIIVIVVIIAGKTATNPNLGKNLESAAKLSP